MTAYNKLFTNENYFSFLDSEINSVQKKIIDQNLLVNKTEKEIKELFSNFLDYLKINIDFSNYNIEPLTLEIVNNQEYEVRVFSLSFSGFHKLLEYKTPSLTFSDSPLAKIDSNNNKIFLKVLVDNNFENTKKNSFTIQKLKLWINYIKEHCQTINNSITNRIETHINSNDFKELINFDFDKQYKKDLAQIFKNN